MTNSDIYILSAKRTAIGTFGGTLKDFEPADLGAVAARAAIAEAGIEAGAIGNVVFGMVLPTQPRDAYLARIIGMNAGLPVEVPAMTINRLCGSGLQAILTAAHSITVGDAEIALAGGAEVMSRAPYYAPSVRWGAKMGDAMLVDGLNGGLTDPFNNGLMGVTAENVADRYDISRELQDEVAAESHRRAAQAIAEGRFTSQIAPVEVRQRKQTISFEVDEHVRAETTAEGLSGLRTIFRKDGGSVTAGNASGINDGAAAVILASESAVKKHGLKPMARLVSWGHAGVDPAYMGIGPVPATRQALERAGLTVGDLDLVESNEAFAAQACAVAKELGFDPEKTNPNGSGISLGHPVGATGAINTTKLVHELHRTSGKHGLATMCIGGGQGIAAIFERV
ncbi:beta-ketothiolase BktB [Alteraurantiacibacter aquimixticola]|uniref:Acetyl-CoA C-acyltransferase n=1 Tax=Alteraurantiacibacter aquimixticola TaxID=2489173 RepID=A0A4T3F3D2_9SPHN|nr:beta-ketothiolase BktB [Alteraurantiacibacter aquimixticola]TIX51713.1 acetyl-CoA C-acyltransferase [Alteraurantiacibacter aquimixticola]